MTLERGRKGTKGAANPLLNTKTNKIWKKSLFQMRKLARWFHQSAVTTPCTIQTALLPVRNFLESAIPPCHNSVRPPDPRLLALLRIALVALHAMQLFFCARGAITSAAKSTPPNPPKLLQINIRACMPLSHLLLPLLPNVSNKLRPHHSKRHYKKCVSA